MATSGDDATYQPDNFREQGGRWVIGAQCDVVSGGSINLESGGTITMDNGGAIAMPVTTRTASQTATAIPEYGITTIEATTSAPVYTLAGPSMAGLTKVIAVTANTSSGTCRVSSETTAVSFATSGPNQLTFDAIGDRVILVSISTAAWVIASNVGSVGVATKST